MPELPEVETVKETLKTFLLGRTITGIIVNYERTIEGMKADEFKAKLIGETFRAIDRLGKYLIFKFDYVSMISHMRMEGKYYYKTATALVEKHEHIIFELDNSMHLRYHDTRKFGRMTVVASTDYNEVIKSKSLRKLGPDAIGDGLSAAYLKKKFKNRKKELKTLLLDQTIVAGIGNIYANEVCFLSLLHPKENAANLSDDDFENLAQNIRTVLHKAVACGGTTIRSYTSSLGVTGRFQQELCVHMRTGKPCPRCGEPVIKITVGGRGTNLCPKCQILKANKE
jgi:formamidopyrimidine-DNA glycosylase